MNLLDEIDVAVLCERCGEGEVVVASSLLGLPNAPRRAEETRRPPLPRSPPRSARLQASLWLSLPAALYRFVHEESARRAADRGALCRWEDDGGPPEERQTAAALAPPA